MTPSRSLTAEDAAIARALTRAGMWQHDVASLFGVNPGRIAEISTRARFRDVAPADLADPAVRARIATLLADMPARIERDVGVAVTAPQPSSARLHIANGARDAL